MVCGEDQVQDLSPTVDEFEVQQVSETGGPERAAVAVEQVLAFGLAVGLVPLHAPPLVATEDVTALGSEVGHEPNEMLRTEGDDDLARTVVGDAP